MATYGNSANGIEGPSKINVFKGASEFFLDTLQEEPKHKWLVTNPSISPENGHPYGAAVCAGPTMDQQILRDLFANTIKAASLSTNKLNEMNALLKARADAATAFHGKK